ncbi:von willebrand factor type A domain protein [Ceratobasidium sp. AG-Ba]|nr:von willebrand factor type A domain protein [Ceratobasidium sp. AG-Ba]
MWPRAKCRAHPGHGRVWLEPAAGSAARESGTDDQPAIEAAVPACRSLFDQSTCFDHVIDHVPPATSSCIPFGPSHRPEERSPERLLAYLHRALPRTVLVDGVKFVGIPSDDLPRSLFSPASPDMSTSPAKDGVYRIRTAEEPLYWDLDTSQVFPTDVVLGPLNEGSDAQKWNLVVRSGTFIATNISNNLKLSYDVDNPDELSGNGSLIVSSTKSTTWVTKEKQSPLGSKFAEISVAYAQQDPDVVGTVLDSLYSNKVVHFSPPRDGALKQRWLFEFVSDPPAVSGTGGDQIQVGTNVTEEFVPSGTYSFHNVKYGNVINVPEDEEELEAGGPQSLDGNTTDKWIITLSSSKKFTIKNAKSDQFAQKSPDTDGVITQTESSHVWVIKQVKSQPDAYQIFAQGASARLWAFSDGQLATKVEFSRAKDNSTWWNIKKQKSIGESEGGQNEIPTPIPNITRPGDKGVKGNTFEITVPKGWSVVVTGLGFQNAINLIVFKAAVGPLVDVFNFYNERSQAVVPLKIQNQTEQAYNASADKGPIALSFTFYGSLNPKKSDPFSLQDAPSIDTRNFPDYRTYYITATEGTTGNRALITVQLTHKQDPGSTNQPDKPEQGTVNPGYPETCDEARPDCLDQYLRKYDSVFLVDDSGSMAGQRWTEACGALKFISEEALQYDADGIGLLFLNSPLRAENLKGEDELQKILNNVSASGGTPTGARLDVVLGDYIRKLDAAVNTPAYGAIKPLDLIVITDGEPTDDPKPVLEKWAGHLDAKKHHPNIVGIQFVQIGDVASATAALIELTKGKVRSMVDTVPYNGNFTPEKLARVLLGAVMPSIRAKQNARLP